MNLICLSALIANAVHGEPALPPVADCPSCNFVIVVLDVVRAFNTSPYGYERDTTPNLRRAAEQGVLFEKAYSVATWTVPSVGSMLSLSQVIDNGLDFGWDPTFASWHEWSSGITPVARVLQSRGWTTEAFIQSSVVRQDLGFPDGFMSWNTYPDVSPPFDEVAQEMSAQAKKEKPFFFYVHYRGAHVSLLPPEEYRSLFTADGKPLEYPEGGFTYDHAKQVPDGAEKFITAFDQTVRWYDDGVGTLLDTWNDPQVSDKTYFLVLADHGESLGEGQKWTRWGHCGSAWEERSRIPMVLLGPGLPKGYVVKSAVSSLDIIRTVLSIVGADPDGVSTWRGVELRETSPTYIVTQGSSKDLEQRWVSLRTQDGLKVRIQNSTSKTRLYDLSQEDTIISPANDPALLQALDGAVRYFQALEQTAPQGSAGGTEINLSEEELQKLRELGYIE